MSFYPNRSLFGITFVTDPVLVIMLSLAIIYAAYLIVYNIHIPTPTSTHPPYTTPPIITSTPSPTFPHPTPSLSPTLTSIQFQAVLTSYGVTQLADKSATFISNLAQVTGLPRSSFTIQGLANRPIFMGRQDDWLFTIIRSVIDINSIPLGESYIIFLITSSTNRSTYSAASLLSQMIPNPLSSLNRLMAQTIGQAVFDMSQPPSFRYT